jgi:hypothetical protein
VVLEVVAPHLILDHRLGVVGVAPEEIQEEMVKLEVPTVAEVAEVAEVLVLLVDRGLWLEPREVMDVFGHSRVLLTPVAEVVGLLSTMAASETVAEPVVLVVVATGEAGMDLARVLQTQVVVVVVS